MITDLQTIHQAEKCFNVTHSMIIEHELNLLQFDQLADTVVAYGQVREESQCSSQYLLTVAPILQVGNAESNYNHTFNNFPYLVYA